MKEKSVHRFEIEQGLLLFSIQSKNSNNYAVKLSY